MIFEIGERQVRLAVIRPDTDVIGYRTKGKTAELAIANARADGVNVSDIHAMKEWPQWAQRTFFRTHGWQINWKMLGWALVKPAKAEVAA